MSNLRFSHRQFLNLPNYHGNGNISIQLAVTEKDSQWEKLCNAKKQSELPYLYPEAQLDISDCERTIHLELDLPSLTPHKSNKIEDYLNGYHKNNIHKLNSIIEACEKAKDWLENDLIDRYKEYYDIVETVIDADSNSTEQD